MRLAVACTHARTRRSARGLCRTPAFFVRGGEERRPSARVSNASPPRHSPPPPAPARPPSRCSPRPDSIAADSPLFVLASMRCRRDQSSTLPGALAPLHRGGDGAGCATDHRLRFVGGWLESSKDEVLFGNSESTSYRAFLDDLGHKFGGGRILGLASAWLFL